MTSLSTLCSAIACISNMLILQHPATDGFLRPALSASISAIVNANIEPHQVVYLINNQSTMDVRPLITQLQRPIILANHDNHWNNIDADLWYSPHTLDAFVLVLCAQDLWQCHLLIVDEIRRHVFNPRRKVLMQLLQRGRKSLPTEDEQLLREVFEQFHRINLLNVVIRLDDDDRKLQSFTFDPFGETFLINLTSSSNTSTTAAPTSVTTIRYISYINDGFIVKGIELTLQSLFDALQRTAVGSETGGLYSNRTKNMHKHPFRMSLFESPPYLVNFSRDGDLSAWYGYDGGMLDAIVEHFNATLQLVIPVNNDPG